LLTAANLASVKHYGEVEFWFAVVKVVAILIFLGCGIAAIARLIPSVHVHASANIFGASSFAPKGCAPIAGPMLTTMFTFLCTEVPSRQRNPRIRHGDFTRDHIRRLAHFAVLYRLRSRHHLRRAVGQYGADDHRAGRRHSVSEVLKRMYGAPNG
jgi:hypothetical protein